MSNVDKHAVDGEPSVRLCNYTDVYKNELISDDLPFMEATATPGQIAQFRLFAGDTVFTKDSETADDIGIPAFVDSAGHDLVCGYHLAILHPNLSRIVPKYLFWAMQSKAVYAQWEVLATGVTRVGLKQRDMTGVTIQTPDRLVEQQAIADFLDRETAKIDALIEKQNTLIDRLRERRNVRIFTAVTKGLNDVPMRESGVDWIGNVPAHWKVAHLRRFAAMRTGHTPSKNVPEYWENCTIPWFTLADVWQLRPGTQTYLGETNQLISELGLANSAAELLPAGTVVLSRTASVGFSGIMPVPMATSQDYWNWVCGPSLVPEYLLNVFRAMREEFEALRYGSTHKTIYQGDAAGIRVPIPPTDEQEAIVSHLDHETRKIDNLISKADRFVELAKERRAALITAAVTGQIDVTGGAKNEQTTDDSDLLAVG